MIEEIKELKKLIIQKKPANQQKPRVIIAVIVIFERD